MQQKSAFWPEVVMRKDSLLEAEDRRSPRLRIPQSDGRALRTSDSDNVHGEVHKRSMDASPGKENRPEPKIPRLSSPSSHAATADVSSRKRDPKKSMNDLVEYANRCLRDYRSGDNDDDVGNPDTVDSVDDVVDDLLPVDFEAVFRAASGLDPMKGACSLPIVNFMRDNKKPHCGNKTGPVITNADSLNKRRLCSVKTNLRLGTCEDGGESDDEFDQQWLVQKKMAEFDEFTDVNEGD
ncbi:unnamed protein product [Notodromas monacha]|uniref:Uncharacterized protein n=1 Tax=Notodromas monacha TaxID=399045 RepID=A0A7R9BPJ3_9CRUS|nr:unnamed protein product [Notodromas monacha]CAG0919274.1 unnamed protein product [Notodromas monacha]